MFSLYTMTLSTHSKAQFSKCNFHSFQRQQKNSEYLSMKQMYAQVIGFFFLSLEMKPNCLPFLHHCNQDYKYHRTTYTQFSFQGRIFQASPEKLNSCFSRSVRELLAIKAGTSLASEIGIQNSGNLGTTSHTFRFSTFTNIEDSDTS